MLGLSVEKENILSENFTFLVKNNYKNVFSLAIRIVKNREDAEDITQEVFMKYYTNRYSFRNDSKLSTFLYRITYNLSIDYLRKRKQFCELEDVVYEPVLDDDHQEERIGRLELELKELSLEEQLIVTLYYMDKKSVDEISKIISLSTSNVKIKLFRIRKKLGEKLGEQVYE